MSEKSSKQSEKAKISERPKIINDPNGKQRICVKDVISGRFICQSRNKNLASNISSAIVIISLVGVSIIVIGLIFYMLYLRKSSNQHKLINANYGLKFNAWFIISQRISY